MEGPCCVSGTSLGQAYERAIQEYRDGFRGRSMVVTCTQPSYALEHFDGGNRISDWEPVLNLGEIYDDFCAYAFDRESPLVHGSTGRD